MFEWFALQYIKQQLAFTGLMPFFVQYGVWAVAIASLLAIAFFSPIFKKTALTGAVCIAVWLVAYTWGAKDGAHRVKAQWDKAVELSIKESERERAIADKSVPIGTGDHAERLPDDRFDRDNWKAPEGH